MERRVVMKVQSPKSLKTFSKRGILIAGLATAVVSVGTYIVSKDIKYKK